MSKPQGCRENSIEVTEKDLPLCCPMPGDRLWDAHPRVYLPIETKGEVVCPYCEIKYTLRGMK